MLTKIHNFLKTISSLQGSGSEISDFHFCESGSRQGKLRHTLMSSLLKLVRNAFPIKHRCNHYGTCHERRRNKKRVDRKAAILDVFAGWGHGSVSDPDPCGSVLKWLPWIRIRIGNTDLDQGQSKWCPKRGKNL